MTAFFNLDFHGTTFTVTKNNLIKFFLHRPEVFLTTTYNVQSSVPLEIFELFAKAVETGTKITIVHLFNVLRLLTSSIEALYT
jgi:hypothetical protein